jgi:hypothetical protein
MGFTQWVSKVHRPDPDARYVDVRLVGESLGHAEQEVRHCFLGSRFDVCPTH